MKVFALSSTKQRALALVGAAALSLTVIAPAMADDTVTTEIQPGTRSAVVADTGLGTSGVVSYSHSAQNADGTMVLTADDSTGSGAGWHVTIQSSQFVYSGSNGGTNIPATAFSIQTADAPVSTAGQAVDPTDGPKVPTTSPAGALNTAREVVEANANFGQGTYTQDIDVRLVIPAQSRAGDYTATLTTTIVAGP